MNAFAYDIDYNEHNLPEKIYDSGDTEYKIFYGTDQQRKKTELSYSNHVVETKYYLGAYEKEITDEGTRELNYVPTPNGISAVYIQTLSGAEMYYIHTDYLGSIAAISKSDRTLEQDYYYTAWGKRQILNNRTGSTDFFIDRGYVSLRRRASCLWILSLYFCSKITKLCQEQKICNVNKKCSRW